MVWEDLFQIKLQHRGFTIWKYYPGKTCLLFLKYFFLCIMYYKKAECKQSLCKVIKCLS